MLFRQPKQGVYALSKREAKKRDLGNPEKREGAEQGKGTKG